MIEKGIESSKAAERTGYRSVRRHYWRRKIRKIRLLTILSENDLCPPLKKEQLGILPVALVEVDGDADDDEGGDGYDVE